MLNNEIGNKYILTKILGVGSFGYTYKGYNKRTKEDVAIKLENNNLKYSFFKNEAIFYRFFKFTDFIPNIRTYGKNGNDNYIVMDLLGPSLTNYHILSVKHRCNYTIARLIEIITIVHNEGVIHRDIKPDNFLFDTKNEKIFIIDFGMSRFYKKDNKHIPFERNHSIIGSKNYCSVNVHNRQGLYRRDDLESIAYIYLFLKYRELPWQNFDCEEEIKNSKLNYRSDKIYNVFIDYVRSLDFSCDPDYLYIRRLFIIETT